MSQSTDDVAVEVRDCQLDRVYDTYMTLTLRHCNAECHDNVGGKQPARMCDHAADHRL